MASSNALTRSSAAPPPAANRWLMMSDVCKHCAAAPCQQACPTGAIVYNEFANVYIQPDICNGCAYCIAACPFGVITRSHFDGHAHKCTLCYDRQRDGLVPACAKACPTASIQFGPIDELRDRARRRVDELRAKGSGGAYVYGDAPTETVVDDGSGPGSILRASSRFGPYEIVRELARGGMGAVFVARRDGDDRQVALKVILDEHDPSPATIRRFEREIRAGLALDHPGIVRILDTGNQDGRLYFTMELVAGRSLDAPSRSWRPIGSSRPNAARASASLTTTTAGVVESAFAGNVAPRTSGIPIARK